jgi:flagellar basal body-associated protein FliL
MPGAGRAEIYFIVAMMILIVILSITAVVAFFKTYKKEMREKAVRESARDSEQTTPAEKTS